MSRGMSLCSLCLRSVRIKVLPCFRHISPFLSRERSNIRTSVTLAILRLNGARRAGTVSVAGVDYFLILPLASNCLR